MGFLTYLDRYHPALEMKKWRCRCVNLPQIARRVKEKTEEFLTLVSVVLITSLFDLFGIHTQGSSFSEQLHFLQGPF